MSDDPINPKHYKAGSRLQHINIVEAYNLNYCEGHVIRYVLRAHFKNNHLEDLKKAEWYLKRAIQRLENGVDEDGVTK